MSVYTQCLVSNDTNEIRSVSRPKREKYELHNLLAMGLLHGFCELGSLLMSFWITRPVFPMPKAERVCNANAGSVYLR